jgi:hypothetical protein
MHVMSTVLYFILGLCFFNCILFLVWCLVSAYKYLWNASISVPVYVEFGMCMCCLKEVMLKLRISASEGWLNCRVSVG